MTTPSGNIEDLFGESSTATDTDWLTSLPKPQLSTSTTSNTTINNNEKAINKKAINETKEESIKERKDTFQSTDSLFANTDTDDFLNGLGSQNTNNVVTYGPLGTEDKTSQYDTYGQLGTENGTQFGNTSNNYDTYGLSSTENRPNTYYGSTASGNEPSRFSTYSDYPIDYSGQYSNSNEYSNFQYGNSNAEQFAKQKDGNTYNAFDTARPHTFHDQSNTAEVSRFSTYSDYPVDYSGQYRNTNGSTDYGQTYSNFDQPQQIEQTVNKPKKESLTAKKEQEDFSEQTLMAAPKEEVKSQPKDTKKISSPPQEQTFTQDLNYSQNYSQPEDSVSHSQTYNQTSNYSQGYTKPETSPPQEQKYSQSYNYGQDYNYHNDQQYSFGNYSNYQYSGQEQAAEPQTNQVDTTSYSQYGSGPIDSGTMKSSNSQEASDYNQYYTNPNANQPDYGSYATSSQQKTSPKNVTNYGKPPKLPESNAQPKPPQNDANDKEMFLNKNPLSDDQNSVYSSRSYNPSDFVFCALCKRRNDFDSNFCSKCGNSLKNATSVPVRPASVSLPYQPPQSAKETRQPSPSYSTASAESQQTSQTFPIYNQQQQMTNKDNNRTFDNKPSPLYSNQAVPPSASTAEIVDPLQRKGCPLVTFGFGGRLLVMFTKTTSRFSMQTGSMTNKTGPGLFHLHKVSDLIKPNDALLDSDGKKLVGPFSLKKKKEVSQWIDTRIQKLESQKENSEKLMLWYWLKKVVDSDAKITSLNTLDAFNMTNSNKSSASISLTTWSTILYPTKSLQSPGKTKTSPLSQSYDSLPNYGQSSVQESTESSYSQIAAPKYEDYTSDWEQKQKTLAEMKTKVLAGQRAEAVQLAIKAELWDHALLLAAHVTKETYDQVVKKFAQKQNDDLLNTFYQVLGGDQDVFHGQSIEKWKEYFKMLLNNRPPNDAKAFKSLGQELLQHGLYEASHLCFLLAGDIQWDGVHSQQPHRLVLLGAHPSPQLHFNWEAILKTELVEFAFRQQQTTFLFPHLQAYKLNYAFYLADLGMLEQSLRYCESIIQMAKGSAQSQTQQPYLHSFFFSKLADLHDRLLKSGWLTGIQTQQDTMSWFTKKGFMEVFDYGLNKIIGDQPTATTSTTNAIAKISSPGKMQPTVQQVSHSAPGSNYGYDSYQNTPQFQSAGQQTPTQPPEWQQPNAQYDPYATSDQKQNASQRQSFGSSYSGYQTNYPAYGDYSSTYNPQPVQTGYQSPAQQTDSGFQSQSTHPAADSGYSQNQAPYDPRQSYYSEYGSNYGMQSGQYGIQPAETSPKVQQPAKDTRPHTYYGQGYNDYHTNNGNQQTQQNNTTVDEEDFGFGNMSLSKGKKKPEDGPAKETTPSAPKKEEESSRTEISSTNKTAITSSLLSTLGSLGSFFRRESSVTSTSAKEVKLGEENAFRYDPVLKKWVSPNANASTEPATPLPPPPSSQPPTRPPTAPPSTPQVGSTFSSRANSPAPFGSTEAAPVQRRAGTLRRGARSRYVDTFNPELNQQADQQQDIMTQSTFLPPPTAISALGGTAPRIMAPGPKQRNSAPPDSQVDQ